MKKNKIQMYVHCKTCLDIKNMIDRSKIAVGLTKDNELQIWCENCDQQVGIFKLK